MSKEYSYPTFEKQIAEVVMPLQPRPEFRVELKQKIMRRTAQVSTDVNVVNHRSYRRWVPAAFTLLLVLAFLVSLTNPQIAAAMQRLFKFLPGIGVVETSQFKVLAEEVTVERDGVTVRVSGAAADPQRTRILLDVEGKPLAYVFGDLEGEL